MAMLWRYSAVYAAVALALAVGMAAAQAPAEAPAAGISSECMTAVLNMSDCLSYVQSGSTARHPEKPCCPEFDGLLQSNPVCLCQLLAGGADSYGVSVDLNRAMELPGKCGLTAPPVSACAAFGVPVPGMGLGPSADPLTGISPSTGPQMPENPPSGSPKSPNHAPGRFSTRGLVGLGVLPLAITVAGMF